MSINPSGYQIIKARPDLACSPSLYTIQPPLLTTSSSNLPPIAIADYEINDPNLTSQGMADIFSAVVDNVLENDKSLPPIQEKIDSVKKKDKVRFVKKNEKEREKIQSDAWSKHTIAQTKFAVKVFRGNYILYQ